MLVLERPFQLGLPGSCPRGQPLEGAPLQWSRLIALVIDIILGWKDSLTRVFFSNQSRMFVPDEAF